MPAGARRDWAPVTRAESGPGAPARRCTAGAIRAIAIPTTGGGGGSGGDLRARSRSSPPTAQQPAAAPGSDYSQPISTTAAAPEQAVAGQATRRTTRPARRSRRATTPRPCSSTSRHSPRRPMTRRMHEFLALAYFAQGKYQQAAAPLYAVLSVRPGWDWTTLSGMYPDVDTYTAQLRALEAYVKANPDSAQGRFVLAYQYLAQGHDPEADRPAQGGREAPAWRHALGADHRRSSSPPAPTNRRPPRRPRPLRRPSKGSWPGTGPPRRPRTRRSPWRSRTTALHLDRHRLRASRR